MNLENKKLSVSVSYDASSNSHRTGTRMNCRNFYSVQFHAEKKKRSGQSCSDVNRYLSLAEPYAVFQANSGDSPRDPEY